ncbi:MULTISPECIES: hypothetical protein [Streptomyces]
MTTGPHAPAGEGELMFTAAIGAVLLLLAARAYFSSAWRVD